MKKIVAGAFASVLALGVAGYLSKRLPAQDLVTALDPKLCIVYRQAGLLLTSSEITDLAAARRLLYAGLAACPDDSYIPFVLGFNLYYFDHRFKEAVHMLGFIISLIIVALLRTCARHARRCCTGIAGRPGGRARRAAPRRRRTAAAVARTRSD